MAGAKNVIDMRPGKGFTTSQSNEHLRVFSDKDRAKKAQWNYDPSREHLNFEIGKGGVVMKVNKMKSIPQRIAENLEARGIKDPNLSLINQGKRPYFKTVANFILGGNREVMRNLAFGNQNVNWEQGADNTQLKRMPEIENWAKDAYRFMCKKYGEKNIAAFVVHLDEANPHIHCTVLPITPKEKFSFLGVFLDGHDDKEALSRHMTNLHTEFANEVGIKYGLERGDSTKKLVPNIVRPKSTVSDFGRKRSKKKLRWRKTTRPSRAIKRLSILRTTSWILRVGKSNMRLLV